MNIPIGKTEAEQKGFDEEKPFERLKSMVDTGFNGYLVATIEGVTGLEEGLLMVREKEIVGAIFDALRVNKQLYGIPALRLVLNLLKAKKGVFDVNGLSKQQIDLIIAFNEKVHLHKPVNMSLLKKLEPEEYRKDLVSKEMAFDLTAEETKQNLLKRMGLGSI